jgi:hypothetical protein
MSDDELLHAAQARLDAKRAALGLLAAHPIQVGDCVRVRKTGEVAEVRVVFRNGLLWCWLGGHGQLLSAMGVVPV